MHEFRVKLVYPSDAAQLVKLCNRYFFPIDIRQVDRSAVFDAKSLLAVSNLVGQECFVTCYEDLIERFRKDIESTDWYMGEVVEYE